MAHFVHKPPSAKGIREPFRIPGLMLHNVKLKDVAMRHIFSMQENNFHIEKNITNNVDFKEENFCLI